MATARSKHNWAQTAEILALIANVNRDPKRRAYSSKDFNPHTLAEREEPVTRVSVTALKGFITGEK